jgi:nucleoside-diphosphate-sugar epimerase
MHGERVLVGGDAGNVGSHIVDLAVQGGADEVIVLDELVRGRNENLTWGARRRARLGGRGRRLGPRARRRVLGVALHAAVELPTGEDHHPYGNNTLSAELSRLSTRD